MYKLYRLVSPEGKMYFGITKNTLPRRWQNGLGYQCNTALYQDILNYGWTNFTHELVGEWEDKDEAAYHEAYNILMNHTYVPNWGYNNYINKETIARIYYTMYEVVETGEIFRTQEEIAKRLGVSSVSVSKAIKKGYKCQGNTITTVIINRKTGEKITPEESSSVRQFLLYKREAEEIKSNKTENPDEEET